MKALWQVLWELPHRTTHLPLCPHPPPAPSCLQFLQRCEALLDSITPELFSAAGPTRCFILLGVSTSRPREAYEVLLPAAAPAPPAGGCWPDLTRIAGAPPRQAVCSASLAAIAAQLVNDCTSTCI